MIVPDSRRTTWEGMVGMTIPSGQTIFTTLTPLGGGSNDQPQVQAAIDSCPANQVVKLNAGTFNFNATDLSWDDANDGVVLRGSGTASTIINLNSNAQIGMRSPNRVDPSIAGSNRSALTGNAAKGDTSFTVASATWVTVGDTIAISQLDDTAFVNPAGESNSTATSLLYNGNRGLSQLVKVTGKASNTLTIESPLCWDFTTALTAQIAQVATSFLSGCGIEDLTLNPTYSADLAVFTFDTVQECFANNVNITNVNRNGFLAHVSHRLQIQHCTFTGGSLVGGGQGYAVALYNVCSNCLITDNIAIECHLAFSTNHGCSVNAITYNFEIDGVASSRQAPSIGMHGYHCMMNLYEGNYCNDKILLDNTHGSGSHNTALRNRIVGYNPVYGEPPNPFDMTAFHNYKWNRFTNIVGNILGKVSYQTSAQTWSPTAFDSDTDKIVIRGGDNAAGTGSGAGGDSLAVSDPIIEGNWDSVSQTVTWSITPEAIPDSYYLTQKPANFGILAWPVYTSSVGNSASEEDIPAGYRYVNGVDPPQSGGDGTIGTLTVANLIIG